MMTTITYKDPDHRIVSMFDIWGGKNNHGAVKFVHIQNFHYTNIHSFFTYSRDILERFVSMIVKR